LRAIARGLSDKRHDFGAEQLKLPHRFCVRLTHPVRLVQEVRQPEAHFEVDQAARALLGGAQDEMTLDLVAQLGAGRNRGVAAGEPPLAVSLVAGVLALQCGIHPFGLVRSD
jgi:hypothetical protein